MSISGETPRENLTLSEADLAACRPIVGEGGHVLRALCPFHGSDRQRSPRVQVHSGRFVCFACGDWGYMETARAQWREEQQRQAALQRPPTRRQRVPHCRQPPPRLPRQLVAAARQRSPDPPTPRAPAPARPDLAQQLAVFQAALPGSRGEAYLQQRGVSLTLALQYGVGYAAPGTWPGGGSVGFVMAVWRWTDIANPSEWGLAHTSTCKRRWDGGQRAMTQDARHDRRLDVHCLPAHTISGSMAVLPLDRPRPLPLRCDDLKPKPLFVPDRRQAHADGPVAALRVEGPE